MRFTDKQSPLQLGDESMLTPRQIEQVKATVPVLREHGVLLTTHFYRRTLEGNPELRNIFNQAHQARGRQQKGTG